MKSLALFAGTAVLAAFALSATAAPPPLGKVARLERKVAALQATVGRLQTEVRLLSQAGALSLRREAALKRRLAAVDPCPITQPNRSSPPGAPFGAEFHGNGALWVRLPSSTVVVDVPEADGAISQKLGWWRGVSGTLRIDGRRLDGPGPPLRSNVPDGYGETGFQSSALTFPVPGCWEVTGHVGDQSLTFVTLAIGA